MWLRSASVSRATCLLMWIHLMLCPCGRGTKTHGPPSSGTKTHGPPSSGTKTYGPPSSGTRTHGPPSSGTNTHGPPSSGTRTHGPPSSGTRTHGPPSSGTRTHGPPSSGTRTHGPPSSGTRTHGPPSSGTRTHGPPSSGTRTHGPPSSGTRTHGPPPGAAGPQAPVERWVQAGFQYLKMTLCRHRGSSMPEGDCRRLAHLHTSGVVVYASEPVDSDKVVAVLPDSYPPLGGPAGPGGGASLRRRFPGATAHDAVLVLDPSPGHSFGHPLVLFYVDRNVTEKRCSHMDGVHSGEECVTLAVKGHCQNQLKRCSLGAGPERILGNGRLGGGAGRLVTMAMRSGGRLGGGATWGLCEAHFLPLVVGVADQNRTQRLRCVDHPEFSRCPWPLPSMAPPPSMHQGSSCELSKNTRRCHMTQLLATPPSCRLYQTCDHAVLLAGGWQQQITFQSHVQKLLSFYRMLRSNGLRDEHIKTFFAGNNNQHIIPEVEGVQPAVDKASVRKHISYVCGQHHCADSLVLYLNSPTRCDGTMLLWDHNHNGIADLKERYSVSELLVDLAGCQASRVLLFVDQSYSQVLDKRLRGSQKHPNVVLIRRGDRPTARDRPAARDRPTARDHQHLQHHQPMEQTSWQNHQKKHQQNHHQNPAWEEDSWDSIRPGTCLLDHLGKSLGMSRLLEPPWAGLLNVTLAGAPCNATPPLTDSEMRREYQGCQNLPTALWHQYPSPHRQYPSPHRQYPSPHRQHRSPHRQYPSPHRQHPSPQRKHY